MKRFLVSAIGILSLFGSLTPLASARTINVTPAGFCRSERFDKTKYRTFVGENALTKGEAAQLARDPEAREAIRRMKADRWGTSIASGQKAVCPAVTYWD